jgi:hypothetical protein
MGREITHAVPQDSHAPRQGSRPLRVQQGRRRQSSSGGIGSSGDRQLRDVPLELVVHAGHSVPHAPSGDPLDMVFESILLEIR